MIVFNDLTISFKHHASELRQAAGRVMKSGVYLMGPELVSFEKEFSQFVGTKYAVGVGSGTDALSLAIRSLGLHDQEVLVPANAYPTAFGIADGKVRMRLCDVDPDTLNISVSTIKRTLTGKTRGVVVVHLYGMPAPMIEIMAFAKKHQLFVIEDCAQAIGAYIHDHHVGTFGDVGCFSFYPTKNLAAMGDGGMVVTRNRRIARRVSQLRVYGEDIRYHSLEVSSHSRLDEIQCAMLRVRLHHLKKDLKQRDAIARQYRRLIPRNLQIPRALPGHIHHASHLMVIKTPQRNELKKLLRKKGVDTMIHYPSPIHLQPAFAYLRYRRGDFPVSEQAGMEVLSLPIYPGLTNAQQHKIVNTVRGFIQQDGTS